MRRLRKEEYLKKTENLDSGRTWRLESQWRVVDSHSAAVFCCSRPMVGLFYKAVPVVADEDKIGGSAITDAGRNQSTQTSTVKLVRLPISWTQPKILTPPSVRTRHQCSNRPNGQTVPRLAVSTVGAIGRDALGSCRGDRRHLPPWPPLRLPQLPSGGRPCAARGRPRRRPPRRLASRQSGSRVSHSQTGAARPLP